MKRPLDFFGPDDWSGGDPDDDIRRIKVRQAEYDKAFGAQSWWRRLFGLDPIDG